MPVSADKAGTLQAALIPPPETLQVHVHGPAPETALGVPALHKLVVGAEASATAPFAEPHTPTTVPATIAVVCVVPSGNLKPPEVLSIVPATVTFPPTEAPPVTPSAPFTQRLKRFSNPPVFIWSPTLVFIGGGTLLPGGAAVGAVHAEAYEMPIEMMTARMKIFRGWRMEDMNYLIEFQIEAV